MRSALRQDNNRKRNSDSPRFGLLRRIFRARSLAQQCKLPVCDRDRLKSFTDGELRSYFYNLGDRVKRHVMDLDPAIARQWKLADDMEAWEFIERLDQLRAHRQVRNSRLPREIGLEPITTPVEVGRETEMAEAFVRTVKRD